MMEAVEADVAGDYAENVNVIDGDSGANLSSRPRRRMDIGGQRQSQRQSRRPRRVRDRVRDRVKAEIEANVEAGTDTLRITRNQHRNEQTTGDTVIDTKMVEETERVSRQTEMED